MDPLTTTTFCSDRVGERSATLSRPSRPPLDAPTRVTSTHNPSRAAADAAEKAAAGVVGCERYRDRIGGGVDGIDVSTLEKLAVTVTRSGERIHSLHVPYHLYRLASSRSSPYASRRPRRPTGCSRSRRAFFFVSVSASFPCLQRSFFFSSFSLPHPRRQTVRRAQPRRRFFFFLFFLLCSPPRRRRWRAPSGGGWVGRWST